MPEPVCSRSRSGVAVPDHTPQSRRLLLSLEASGTSSHMVYIAGELQAWPTREQIATLLRAAGLRVTVSRYSVRMDDCSHFVFQHYGGDLGQPIIDADGESLADLLREAGLVSAALARADLVHRFELYDDSDVMVGYLHHHWPLAAA